jgi:hypothetical protein
MQGIRKGTEINRLEREAKENLLLSDAMEGYDKIRNGEHETRIKRMQNNIAAQTRPSNSTLFYWGIAASILLIIAIVAGGYFLWNQFNGPETILVKENISKPLDTIAAEKSDETAAGPLAKPEVQTDHAAVINSAPPETTIVNDEEITSIPDANKLPVADTIQSIPIDSTENEVITIENGEQKNSILPPEPLLGYNAYNEYLKKNLIRPTDEECKTATGFVSLSFLIDKNGYPYNIHITKSLCLLADWEAMRLVKEGPLWTTSESLATINIYF